MPPRNPFSSFADPNSFLGQPFLPRVAGAISRGTGNIVRAEDQFRSDVISGAQRGLSNLGRLASTVGNALTFPIRAAQQAVSGAPLIGGVAQGRGQRQEPPIPTVPTLPSGTPRVGFDIYPTMPQSVASVNPRVATAEDIAAFRAANFTRPTQPVAPPAQPVATVAPAAPERVGVRTAYGMVYPTKGQEAAAQRLAQMPRMGARLAAVREQLNQQARLEQARLGGRDAARAIAESTTQRGGSQPQQRPVAQPRISPILQQPMQARTQTTQRSWSNYGGPNPIRNFSYSNTPSSFYGFSGGGQPMTRVPTAGGDVVYDEESGRYIPV